MSPRSTLANCSEQKSSRRCERPLGCLDPRRATLGTSCFHEVPGVRWHLPQNSSPPSAQPVLLERLGVPTTTMYFQKCTKVSDATFLSETSLLKPPAILQSKPRQTHKGIYAYMLIKDQNTQTRPKSQPDSARRWQTQAQKEANAVQCILEFGTNHLTVGVIPKTVVTKSLSEGKTRSLCSDSAPTLN